MGLIQNGLAKYCNGYWLACFMWSIVDTLYGQKRSLINFRQKPPEKIRDYS